MSFLTELRQRGVLRVAAWYAAGAWVLIQVASTVFPQFDLPAWSIRAVIVVAVIGLPVALLAAWVFEVTPAGIRRADDADGVAVAAPRAPSWRIPSLWIALAAGALLVVGAQQAWQRLVRPSFGERPSLAVLPFTNMSPDAENAYFADGLHEETLATLARVSGLRVISRTSVEEYRDARRNLKEIAKALNVSLILEGSVRRVGNDVRVTLQLIDGRTDEHVWAQTYDRAFRDVLRLQETVAVQIVSELGAQLAPGEQDRIVRAASSVPEAYDRYLHALALYNETDESQGAVRLLGEAIALDPAFALAHARRAYILAWSYRAERGADTPEVREGARADIERALALQPELPEALVARGVYHTYVTSDPERAFEDLARALELAPSNAEAHATAGYTLRRLGRTDDAVVHFEQAVALSPGQLNYRIEFVRTLIAYGRYEEADRALQALIERHPAFLGPRLLRYFVKFLATGETAGWREEYERLSAMGSELLHTRLSTPATLTCLGDFPGLISYLEAQPAESWDGPETRDYRLGLAHVAAGAPQRARPYLDAVAQIPRDDDRFDMVYGAVALELTGRRAEALRAADAAIRLLPKHDAVNNPHVEIARAWVLIRSGERAEEGYAELKRLLGEFDLQPRWVAVMPPWVLLRDDARVQQIIHDALPR